MYLHERMNIIIDEHGTDIWILDKYKCRPSIIIATSYYIVGFQRIFLKGVSFIYLNNYDMYTWYLRLPPVPTRTYALL